MMKENKNKGTFLNYLLGIFVLLISVQLSAKTIYVSISGKDSNDGTFSKPFRTLKKAVEVLQPGDTCFIRGGRYHENVVINNKIGTSQKPIIISAYQNENVVLDGTVKIKNKWSKHKTNIYKTKLKEDVWQLFVNDESMTSARWPNGNWIDGSLWDKTKSMAWPEKGKGEYGHHFNKGLEELDFNLKNAIILVNSGSFKTFASRVTAHEPSSDNFKYDTSLKHIKAHFSYKGKVFKHGYFLEGKLGLLDEEKEWFYNPNTKELYLWTPDGKNPKDFNIKGKNQTYAISIKNSSYITIEGINFFGTTLASKDGNHITIENCDFKYPSYSKRMVQDLKTISETKLVMKKKTNDAYNTIRNCRFEYADGTGLYMNGNHITIENNLMHNIDYSCITGGYTINMSQATNVKFIRNTVHTGGGSEMYKAGPLNTIAYNNLSKSGHLQNDGSLIQVSVQAQPNSETHHNWVHHTEKQGLRFDNKNTPGAPWGENGTMHHNVAWNTDRIFFKGDNHFIYNNLSFGSHQNDLIISSDVKIQGHNHGTITRNNLANNMSGSRSKPVKNYPIPGIVDHNWSSDVKGGDVGDHLRDIHNLDYRPKQNAPIVDGGVSIKGKEIEFLGNAPDIGAYEYGDENYWIPGFQDKITSVPVPPNNSVTVKQDADLMWLKAYNSEQSDVYFGMDETQVIDANTESKEYIGRFLNNIFTPGTKETLKLKKGETYFWRVDAVVNGKIIKGNIWRFTAEK